MVNSNDGYIYFRRAKPFNRVIINNPCNVIERYKSGANKGKVKSKKKIQFAVGFDTLDPAEQRKIDPNVVPTPLRLDFRRKELVKFSEEDVTLIEFLQKCSDNTDNGGKIFKQVDVLKEKEVELESFFEYDRAVRIIMDADNATTRAMAMWLMGVNKMSAPISNLKLDMRTRCQMPKFQEKVIAFDDDNSNKSNSEKLLIAIALEKNIIELQEGRKFAWTDGEVIFLGSQANDAVKEFSLWLKNDEEGREYVKLMSAAVKKAKS